VVRPWLAVVNLAVAVTTLGLAVWLRVPIPLSPAIVPPWLDVAQQVLFATALMAAFTYSHRRLLAALGERTARLEAAHTELVAARARLGQLVSERTAELERATRDLEEFAATVAHDLQAPLRHVRAYLTMFVEDTTGLTAERLAPLTAVQEETVELAARVKAILASTASRASGHAARSSNS
jgi:signal transduction histidine kinase